MRSNISISIKHELFDIGIYRIRKSILCFFYEKSPLRIKNQIQKKG